MLRSVTAVSSLLPDFPWDALRPYADRARAHQDGAVDLSMGTPTDSTPDVVRAALQAATDAPGYPQTAGSAELRSAIVGYLVRRCGTVGLTESAVLPTIGSKELVGSLPRTLGLGASDVVAIPPLAYPTYVVGALLAGASVTSVDIDELVGSSVGQPVGAGASAAHTAVRREGVSRTPAGDSAAVVPAMIWVNSPANPSGRVLSVEQLRAVVAWGRARGTLVVSDECYLELGWDTHPVSILDPRVCGDSHRGVLAVHSLSKRSNMGGYRAGFVAGDESVVGELLAVRKHAGAIVPAPVQAAMVAALGDDEHVGEQRKRYAARRAALLTALKHAGFRIDHSEAGLYLWATRDEDCWETTGWFADRGIIVSPGLFYGNEGARHVRVALTAQDDRVAAAVSRLTSKLA